VGPTNGILSLVKIRVGRFLSSKVKTMVITQFLPIEVLSAMAETKFDGNVHDNSQLI